MMVMSGPLGYQVADAPNNRTVRFTNRQLLEVGRKGGTDYIATVPIDGLADGDTVFAIRITPAVFPSLARYASSYQRIHWNMLEFQISSQMPTISSGGYIAGFVPDPADTLPVDVQRAKAKLVATPNSIKTNIWDSSCLSVISGRGRTAVECLTQRQLYTSPSEDIREYSPGTFYLVLDGPPSENGSLSLSIGYNVSCKVESVEYDNVLGQTDRIQASASMVVQQGGNQFQLKTDAGSDWETIFPGYVRPIIDVIIKAVDVYATLPVVAGDVVGAVNQATVDTFRYHAAQDNFYATYPDGTPVITGDPSSGAFLATLGACFFLIRSLAPQTGATFFHGPNYSHKGAQGAFSNIPLKPMFQKIQNPSL